MKKYSIDVHGKNWMRGQTYHIRSTKLKHAMRRAVAAYMEEFPNETELTVKCVK